MESIQKIFIALLLLALSTVVSYLYSILWLRPENIRRELRRQGVTGPRPSPLVGNLVDMRATELEERSRRGAGGVGVTHDHGSTLFPYFHRWIAQYGSVFVYSRGNMIVLYVGDLSLLKEICLSKTLELGRPIFSKKNYGALIGDGVVSSNGAKWVMQRKIIAPEFFMDKVKGMMNLMVESALPLLKSWETRVELAGGVADVKVDEDLKTFSVDVISRACFGRSNCKGAGIFSKIITLQKALSAQTSLIGIPGLRYLPTKSNREIWRLAREIKGMVLEVVKGRKEGAGREADFLQSILHAAEGLCDGDNFIVDNCKSIFFNGHETITTASKWVLVLLALNAEWQERVRSEVVDVCGSGLPDWEMLRRMPLLTMVIHETLRLYPGSPMVVREALQELKLGDLRIPKGTILWIPSLQLHHDPKLWGSNAHRFDPERFANGISGACKPSHAYIPFGVGPHTCLGQNFAMVELKMVLSLILSRFSISISPNYRHSPVHRLTLEPEHGVHLLLKKVEPL